MRNRAYSLSVFPSRERSWVLERIRFLEKARVLERVGVLENMKRANDYYIETGVSNREFACFTKIF